MMVEVQSSIGILVWNAFYWSSPMYCMGQVQYAELRHELLGCWYSKSFLLSANKIKNKHISLSPSVLFSIFGR